FSLHDALPILMMVGNFYAQLMIIQNRQGRLLRIQATALVLNILLNLLLLPPLGVRGAGVALFISQAVILTLYLVEHRPDRATTWTMTQRTLRVTIAGLAMAATLVVLGGANLFIAGSAGMAVYAAVAIVLRVLLPDDCAL